MLDDLPDAQAERVKTVLGKLRQPPVYSRRQGPYDPMATLKRYKLKTPEQIVRHYVDRLIQVDVPAEKIDILVSVLSPKGQALNRKAAKQTARRIREVIFLIMSMPEYQLI